MQWVYTCQKQLSGFRNYIFIHGGWLGGYHNLPLLAVAQSL